MPDKSNVFLSEWFAMKESNEAVGGKGGKQSENSVTRVMDE